MQTLQREVGTFVGNRAKEYEALKKETAPTKLAELDRQLENAAKWAPGGRYRQIVTVIAAAAGGNVTAGKSFNPTVTWNAVGGYYSAEIKGDDPFIAGLLSSAGASAGYTAGNIIKIPMDKILNSLPKQYERIPTGFLTITKPIPQHPLPSIPGNVIDSMTSEIMQNKITNQNKN